MKPSREEEVADVLDKAHDELLVRGWCQGGATNDAGNVCLMGAVGVVVGANLGRFIGLPTPDVDLTFHGASDVLATQGFSAKWNDADGRTFDDVLDALRDTAKKLRNGELEVA